MKINVREDVFVERNSAMFSFFTRNNAIFSFFAFVLLLLPVELYASTGSTYEAFLQAPCAMIDIIVGPFGKVFVVIIIMFSSGMMLIGKLSLPIGITIIVGIGFLFGAQEIVMILTGDNTPFCGAVNP